MEEKFLHFAWKNIGFRPEGLVSAEGEPVELIHPGIYNNGQGPDFLQGKIRCGGLVFAGDIELHLTTDHWYLHQHHHDNRYNSVILHVVHTSTGEPVFRRDGTAIPEISLEGKIVPHLQQNWDVIRHSEAKIPCEKHFSQIHPDAVIAWAERLTIRRIERKIVRLQKELKACEGDWEQLLWQEMAASFGGTENAEAFRAVARAVPVKILRKYQLKRLQTEALLYGAAGMLSGLNCRDDWVENLCKEWDYLSVLLGMKPGYNPLSQFRMRPASFPHLRISQLAALIKAFPVLTELLLTYGHQSLLEAELHAAPYWAGHIRFGVPGKNPSQKPGKEMLSTAAINTLGPLSAMYFAAHGSPLNTWVIRKMLESLPPENNRVVRLFTRLGIVPAHSFHTQGLLELYGQFCTEKKCLECDVGKWILRGDRACRPD